MRELIFTRKILMVVIFIAGFALGIFAASLMADRERHETALLAETSALVYQGKNDMYNAVNYYVLSKHLNPRNIEVYQALGSLYYELGMYEFALNEFSQSMEKMKTGGNEQRYDKQKHALVLCYIGHIYGKLTNESEAVNSYKDAIGLYGDLPYDLADVLNSAHPHQLELYRAFLDDLRRFDLLPDDLDRDFVDINNSDAPAP